MLIEIDNQIHRWNNTDFKPSSTGQVQWCERDENAADMNEEDKNCPTNRTLIGALTTTIEKYVFFSTDPRYLQTFTDHEEYIIKNHAKDLPKLMYQVGIQRRPKK